MLSHRVIPCLLLQNGRLVKTRRFGNGSYVGDPINAIRIFNDKEADELMILDINASRERREPDYSLIERCASECFMPLGYGGGVRTVECAHRLFSLGVEKVSVRAAALEDLSFLSRLADRFGSQSVVVSIDVKRNWRNTPRLFSSVHGSSLNRDWRDFMIQAVEAGAGEVLLNAVDRDGEMRGMDLPLIRSAAESINVPLTAIGGVGQLDDIKAAIAAGASAVAAGAFFVYHGPHRAVLITYPTAEQLKHLFEPSSRDA
jgi:cyclase